MTKRRVASWQVAKWRKAEAPKATEKETAKARPPSTSPIGPPWTWLANDGPYVARRCSGDGLCMCVLCLGGARP